jgi:N-acetylmuramoyl-L-alanine amidase
MIEKFLTKNPYSRPGSARPDTKALVIHWTANPMQNWSGVWQYFENRKNGKLDYGSSQYVIGLGGEVVLMMPENEVAYHCGSSKTDPASGKIYTDLARARFGKYATDYKTLSPNMVTTGIEFCVTQDNGAMTNETIEAGIQLSADICRKYSLDPLFDILLHKDVVGWKSCHLWWVNRPDAWHNFKAAVKQRMETV